MQASGSTGALQSLLRWAVLLLLSAFAGAVVLQLLLAGLGVFIDPVYFRWHVLSSRMLGPLLIAAIGLALFARAGLRFLAIAAVTFVLYGLQFMFVHVVSGSGRALHVVNALLLFVLTQWLVGEVWRRLRPEQPGSRVPGILTGGVSAVFVAAALLVSPLALRDSQITADMTASEIFSLRCAACHGGNGEGGSGPALSGNAVTQDNDHVAEVIRDGSGAMPAFGHLVTDAQLQDLIRLVAGL